MTNQVQPQSWRRWNRKADRLCWIGLVLLVGACTGNATTVPEPHALETMVSATLTAVAPTTEAGTPASQATSPEPSDPPSPTDPDALTPAPIPPGQYIVLTVDGDIWMLEAESSPWLVLEGAGAVEARVSRDGAWIAYLTRDSDQDTVVFHAMMSDGSLPRTILTQADFDALYPLGDFKHHTVNRFEFIPGTHTVLMNTRGTFEGPGLVKNDDLLLVDLDQASHRILFPPSSGGEFHLSPDGSQIALVTPTSLSLSAIDGGTLRRDVLTFPLVLTYSEFAFYPFPVWAPDSRSLLVGIPSPDPFAEIPTGSIWEIRAEDPDKPIQLFTVQGDLFRIQGAHPILSPDLQYLAYIFGLSDNTSELRILDIPSQSDRQSFSAALDWHGWSPGGQFYLITLGAPRVLHLGKVDLAPTPIQPASSAQWRDGDRFLFWTGPPGNWSLIQASLDGSTRVLANFAAEILTYHLSP